MLYLSIVVLGLIFAFLRLLISVDANNLFACMYQCEFQCRHEQAQILSAIGLVLAPHRKYHGFAFPYIKICDDRVNQNSKKIVQSHVFSRFDTVSIKY